MSTVREKPVAETPSKPMRRAYIGAIVSLRAPGGGVLPLVVDRVVDSRVAGIVLCSRVTPMTHAQQLVPYSTDRGDSSCWCWPDEVPAPDATPSA